MANNDDVLKIIEGFNAELSALKEENEFMLKMIKKIWNHYDGLNCPYCGKEQERYSDHTQDCQLNNLLNKKEGI